MQFKAALIALAATGAIAIPASEVEESTAKTQDFQLKTSVTAGKSDYDGKYLTLYHTGAGTADVVLTDTPQNYFSFNGSNLQYNLPNSTYPFGMAMGQGDNFYQHWKPVQINVGFPAVGKYSMKKKSGLFWNSAPGHKGENAFGGFRVCKAYYEVPQLFYKISYWNVTEDQCNCADVNLMPEYLVQ